jgi:CBS domain-containing protein
MLIQTILQRKGTVIYDIEPDKTVYEAIEKMAEKNIGALLVRKNGLLRGIITERDYLDKIVLKGRTSKTTEVKTIMSSDVSTVKMDDDVEACMVLMTEQKIRHLPVVEGDKVKGTVSIGDLVNAVISKQQGEVHSLQNYISGTYPS